MLMACSLIFFVIVLSVIIGGLLSEKTAKEEVALTAETSRRHSPSVNTGTGFTTIAFSYVDRAGNPTRRTVDVWAVDDDYLEGRCHYAMDKRTFMLSRIQGKITDIDVGESMSVRKWAAAAMEHPDNDEVDYDEIFNRHKPDSPLRAKLPEKPKKSEILFTGFLEEERDRLETLALQHGMQIRKTVTQRLRYLCVGENAGPSKVERARAQGVTICTPKQLMTLWETGELPVQESAFL
jgi:hypothetical protein